MNIAKVAAELVCTGDTLALRMEILKWIQPNEALGPVPCLVHISHIKTNSAFHSLQLKSISVCCSIYKCSKLIFISKAMCVLVCIPISCLGKATCSKGSFGFT